MPGLWPALTSGRQLRPSRIAPRGSRTGTSVGCARRTSRCSRSLCGSCGHPVSHIAGGVVGEPGQCPRRGARIAGHFKRKPQPGCTPAEAASGLRLPDGSDAAAGTSSDDSGETAYPRDRPGNAGKFRRKPPPASRRRPRGPKAAAVAVTKERLFAVKVQITDRDALSAPEPERMRSYLQDQGWERCAREGERPEVWRLPTHDGPYEVLLPSSKEYLDYPQRVSELLRTLSVAEDRSELALWHDLVSS